MVAGVAIHGRCGRQPSHGRFVCTLSNCKLVIVHFVDGPAATNNAFDNEYFSTELICGHKATSMTALLPLSKECFH